MPRGKCKIKSKGKSVHQSFIATDVLFGYLAIRDNLCLFSVRLRCVPVLTSQNVFEEICISEKKNCNLTWQQDLHVYEVKSSEFLLPPCLLG